jgi:pimeloyl-ACP methyl ester carboxylesterase
MPTTATAQILSRCRVEGVPAEARCGSYSVFENRAAQTGRKITLNIVVLPARSTNPKPDPIFVVYGGPGQTATEYAANEWDAWYRDDREVVLVDQRGTGGDNALDCELSGNETNVAGFLDAMFQAPLFRTCRAQLQKGADLRLYSTPIAMDDLDEVRGALGYTQVNLVGGSYGSRAALVYLRQHPASVRSLILTSINPFSFKNPLYHAKAAQMALDSLFAACDRQAMCHDAFPEVRRELAAVLDRLAAHPESVTLAQAGTDTKLHVVLGRSQFAEALRVMMYTPPNAARVPLLIHRAYKGDLGAFARQGLQSNIGLRSMLRFGMLMSTTCTEDVSRITEAEIKRETAGTFLGDSRVRDEIAACKEWPNALIASDYAKPFTSNVPAVLISGAYDPATPAYLGEEAHDTYLPNSVHLVVHQAGHSPRSQCAESISRAFLAAASVKGLDLSCLAQDKLGPFATSS